MNFVNTITIEIPQRDVFSFLAHLENIPRWNYAIVESRPVSEGPVTIGKTYRQIRSSPFRAEELLEISAFDPYHRLQIAGDFGPLHGTLTYELEDRGAATLLTNTADLRAGVPGSVAIAIGRDRIRQSVASNLGVLKALLEGTREDR